MTELVLHTRYDAVAVLTLNRPEQLNAITPDLVSALLTALQAELADAEVRAIVLTGAGDRAFCSGNDLGHDASRYDVETVRAHAQRAQEVTRTIVYGDKPMIAAVNGWAVGGGFEWVLNCDFGVWARGARAFMPELKFGLFVTGGVTALLPRMIGLARTRRLLMLGERIEAEDLHALGLAHAVVEPGAVLQEAISLARQLAELPAGAIANLKSALAHVSRDEFERALEVETDLVTSTFTNSESLARRSAFVANSNGSSGRT